MKRMKISLMYFFTSFGLLLKFYLGEVLSDKLIRIDIN